MTPDDAGQKTTEMWERLAQQFVDIVPDLLIGGDPLRAIQYAMCAEACFWQSTGEADCHGMKDVLAALSSTER